MVPAGNYQLVPAGSSLEQLVPAGTSWYQLVQAGTSWSQLVPAGTSWYPAGTQLVPTGPQLVPAGTQLVPAGTSMRHMPATVPPLDTLLRCPWAWADTAPAAKQPSWMGTLAAIQLVMMSLC